MGHFCQDEILTKKISPWIIHGEIIITASKDFHFSDFQELFLLT
jgi:hypothetical protein